MTIAQDAYIVVFFVFRVRVFNSFELLFLSFLRPLLRLIRLIRSFSAFFLGFVPFAVGPPPGGEGTFQFPGGGGRGPPGSFSISGFRPGSGSGFRFMVAFPGRDLS